MKEIPTDKDFQQELAELQFNRLLLILFLGAVFYPAFALADYLYYPQLFQSFLKLRLAISALCLILMVIIKKRGPRPSNLYLVLIGLYPVCFGILWMIWQVGDPSSPYYAGVILIFIGFATIVPARARFHLVPMLVTFILYVLVAFLSPSGTRDIKLLVLNQIFMLSYAILVLVAAQNNYSLLKKEFIARKRLEAAKAKLDQYAERLEARVMESESNYALLVNSAADAIFVLQDGAVCFANQQTADLFGIELEELLGSQLDDLLADNEKKSLLTAYEKLGGKKEPLTLEPIKLKARNGGPDRWVDIILVPLDWKGRPAILHFVRDITERKRLEEELLQAQKLEAVGRLAGGIAHEINNMLQIIAGYVQLLSIKKAVSEAGQEYLDKIFEAASNASSITKQLLLYCRKTKSEKERVDLNERVAKVARLLEKTLPRMISVRYLLDSSIGPIEADPVQIEQVIMNLAINAKDAMPEGGTLTISTMATEIHGQHADLPGIKPGRYVELRVQDTGFGMDRQTAERIFDPFFTTKEVGKGTGLGLTIVYGIIKGHGGYIYCDTKPGKGTTFRVFLPESTNMDLSEGREKKEPSSRIVGTGRTIMIVDDEAGIREIFAEALSGSGFDVLTATTGEEAMEVLERAREEGRAVELIILDLNMPGMGGMEFLRRIRAKGIDIATIIATGFAKDIDEEIKRELKISAVLKKPFYISELEQTISQILPGLNRQNR